MLVKFRVSTKSVLLLAPKEAIKISHGLEPSETFDNEVVPSESFQGLWLFQNIPDYMVRGGVIHRGLSHGC